MIYSKKNYAKFKLHNNRFYFLVMFKNNSLTWDIGEIFFRKYLTSFHYDSKLISFYRTQIDEINKKTDIPDPEYNSEQNTNNNDSTNNNNYTIKIIICVVGCVVLIAAIITIIILVIKLKKNRKKRADELKDDDYEYIPEEKIIN